MQRAIPRGSAPLNAPAEPLVAEWSRALQEADRAAGTVKKYGQAVGYFLAWYEQHEGAPLHIADLTPISLISYRNYLQHEQQRSRATINLQISALRTWCAWLYDQGHLATDPAARIKLVGGTGGNRRDGLTNTQVHALLRQAQLSREADRNYAILQLLVQTGIRLGECSAIRFGDLSIGERSGNLWVRAGKGNKVRQVPLNASAREALAAYLAPRLALDPASLKVVSARWAQARSERSREALFLSQKGGALTSSAIGQLIADLVAAAGQRVPAETTAHQLRHTFARNYLAQYPGDIVGLAALLGHSSLETTRLYSEPIGSQLADRLEKLALNTYVE